MFPDWIGHPSITSIFQGSFYVYRVCWCWRMKFVSIKANPNRPQSISPFTYMTLKRHSNTRCSSSGFPSLIAIYDGDNLSLENDFYPTKVPTYYGRAPSFPPVVLPFSPLLVVLRLLALKSDSVFPALHSYEGNPCANHQLPHNLSIVPGLIVPASSVVILTAFALSDLLVQVHGMLKPCLSGVLGHWWCLLLPGSGLSRSLPLVWLVSSLSGCQREFVSCFVPLAGYHCFCTPQYRLRDSCWHAGSVRFHPWFLPIGLCMADWTGSSCSTECCSLGIAEIPDTLWMGSYTTEEV